MQIGAITFQTDDPSKCDACERAIEEGEKVHVVTSWAQGEAHSFVECAACARLLADFGELFHDGDGMFQAGCVADALDGGVTAAELLAALERLENEQNTLQ